ncbi:nonsense-mediated mRNA decay factor SMG9 [Euwallacea similis]|uniref:nonsense-mediated mRNA decay factor SMG9 n=1 Tax=Euwallacea similis TaxID=1736056 RepID=UPI00344F4161
MSEFEKKKMISYKNRSSPREASSSNRTFSGKYASKIRDLDSSDVKQPTILLKNKDALPEDNATNIKQKPKDHEATPIISSKDVEPQPHLKYMKKSLKLIEDGTINSDHLQDYLQENSDFIVVGVVGPQGVGKSTLLNLLTEKKVTESVKRSLFKSHTEAADDYNNGITIFTQMLENTHLDEPTSVFKVESLEDIENCENATQGIDIYVSPNRVIFLDCQPFLSVAVAVDLSESENKRSNLVSDFIPLENSGEIQGLQYTAFLMSVCHILLVVQDWFFDSNIVRFIQTAKMLKPTISNPEDEYSEHFPHLIMVQNKAQMADFTPKQFEVMQKVYETLFQKTKLPFHTNLGLGSGRIINTLKPENCGNKVNLFLIPEIKGNNQPNTENDVYSGHPPLEELIRRLRANIFGVTKNSLTHVQLTEKTWLIYCNKVWETVKKSPFFVEYTKLMP